MNILWVSFHYDFIRIVYGYILGTFNKYSIHLNNVIMNYDYYVHIDAMSVPID